MYVLYTGPLSNLRKNEMHLGKQPKLINHGNPVSSFFWYVHTELEIKIRNWLAIH